MFGNFSLFFRKAIPKRLKARLGIPVQETEAPVTEDIPPVTPKRKEKNIDQSKRGTISKPGIVISMI